jgi:hypothetical protein
MSIFTAKDSRTIYFDEALHKYTDELGNNYTSVTQLIGSVKPEFDREYWLVYKALERIFQVKIFPEIKKQQFKIAGTTLTMKEAKSIIAKDGIKEVADDWEKAKVLGCETGTKEHNYLEDSINGFYRDETETEETKKNKNNVRFKNKIVDVDSLKDSKLKETHPTIYSGLIDYVNQGWTIYCEYRIYSPIHLIAGTIDILLIRGKNFIILDWKTNKDELLFNSGYYKKEFKEVDGKQVKVKTDNFVYNDDKFLKPLDNIPLCKGNEYTLQLNIYKTLVEMWGYTCVKLILCHIKQRTDKNGHVVFNEDNYPIFEKPKFHVIKFLTEDVNKLMNYQLVKVNKTSPKKRQFKILL